MNCHTIRFTYLIRSELFLPAVSIIGCFIRQKWKATQNLAFRPPPPPPPWEVDLIYHVSMKNMIE